MVITREEREERKEERRRGRCDLLDILSLSSGLDLDIHWDAEPGDRTVAGC